MDKFEQRFESWLTTFEERPIATGIKLVIVILILRFVWRSFK